MATIYTEIEIAANKLTAESFTTSTGTRGLIVTNYSDHTLTVRVVTQASSLTIPPYSQGKIQIAENTAWTIEASALSVAAPIPNVTRYVEFLESTTPLEPQIVPLAQLPAYTMNVAGNVGITGTTTVNVGNTPTVNLGSTANVNIANTPSVAIASGSVNATIQNASLNSQITNAMIATGPTVSASGVYNVTNLANNARVTIGVTIPPALYDLFVLYVKKTNNGTQFTSMYQIDFYFFGMDAAYTTEPITQVNLSFQSQAYGALSTKTYVTPNQRPQMGNQIFFGITNISGATIASDTLTLLPYLRYASTEIMNSSTNPAVTRDPTATASTNGQVLINSGTATNVIPAGGILYKLHVSLFNNSASAAPGNMMLALNNGSNALAFIDMKNLPANAGRDPVVFDFGPGGIPNNGINAYLLNFGTANAMVVATAVKG